MNIKRYRASIERTCYSCLLLACIVSIDVAGAAPLSDLSTGLAWLDWDFITSMPSRFPEKAGIYSALVGSIWTIGLTAAFSLPLGVGTAVYLEEYTNPKSRINQIVQVNIDNLAGVPAIVYGMLGLAVFVRLFQFERSILAGAEPTEVCFSDLQHDITVALEEAIKRSQKSLREGST